MRKIWGAVHELLLINHDYEKDIIINFALHIIFDFSANPATTATSSTTTCKAATVTATANFTPGSSATASSTITA